MSHPIVRRFALACGAMSATTAVAIIAWIGYLSSTLPNVTEVEERLDSGPVALSSIVVDRRGQTLGTLGGATRLYSPLKQIPPHVQHAFVSAEDKDFFSHAGVSIRGIIRSALINLRLRRTAQGGSTITQQLARLYFLSQERTVSRKIREILLAIRIDASESKERILELYLNHVYLGAGAYGIASAADEFFGKPVSALSVEEAAILAGLTAAPSRLSPRTNPRGARQRRDFVLKRMFEDGYLKKEELRSFISSPLASVLPATDRKMTYALASVRAEVQKRLEVKNLHVKGMHIVSTIDASIDDDLAHSAKVALSLVAPSNTDRQDNKSPRETQVAGIVIDPRDGSILGMVGGSNFAVSEFNRATMGRYRLETLLMPFFVGMAIDRGLELTSRVTGGLLFDQLHQGSWEGLQTITDTLGHGTIRAPLIASGMDWSEKSRDVAQDVLGSLASAARLLSSLPGAGLTRDSSIIKEIRDRQQALLYEWSQPMGKPLLHATSAWMTFEALRLNPPTNPIRLGRMARSSGFSVHGMISKDKSWSAAALLSPEMVAVFSIGDDRRATPFASTDINPALEFAEAFTARHLSRIPKDTKIPQGNADEIQVPLGIVLKRVATRSGVATVPAREIVALGKEASLSKTLTPHQGLSTSSH